MKLKNKVALVTGSSRGIGKEIAYSLAKEGSNIIINYNNSYEEAKELEQKIKNDFNVETLLIKADISNEQEVKNMIKTSIDKFNNIDILVNNAGIAIDTTFNDKTKENFMKILEVNLVGAFLVSKEVSPYMIKNKQGKIINISSTNAINSYYEESLDYDASKQGIISLTHNLALHLSPYVNVNVVAPGWVNTDMNKELTKFQKEKEEEKILLKRFGEPKDIANVVTFLATEDANYINDQVISVDGGRNNA